MLMHIPHQDYVTKETNFDGHVPFSLIHSLQAEKTVIRLVSVLADCTVYLIKITSFIDKAIYMPQSQQS